MKILENKVMRGPNIWSTAHKLLIVLKVRMAEVPEQKRRELVERTLREFPDILESGGPQIEEQAVAGLIPRVALWLLKQAGMPGEFASWKKATLEGEFFIIFSYQIERAGLFAGEAAVRIAEAFLENQPHDVKAEIEALAKIKKKYSLGSTTAYILNEVKRRNIPFRQFENGSLITLGYGKKQKKIRTAVTDSTSGLGIEMAGDKDETKKILQQANIPVPKGILIYSEDELRARLPELQFPIVVKPLDGNHGRGVTTSIDSLDKALFGFNLAQKISDAVIVEEHIHGEDYRFLVIDFKLVAVAKRSPAMVKGNGTSTIRELIEETNRNPERGDTPDHVLSTIRIDAITSKILAEKKLSLDSVLPKDERLVLKDTANISAGGTAADVTDKVHKENKFMAERIAKLFNLNICGVDIMARAIDVPLTREIGAIIEVNAGPGLRMHSNPQEGKARDVASPILDMMFRRPADARIPIVAVTGTNGKTTTTRLIAHLARLAGYTPGYTTTEGIYIDNHLIYKGDCTGFISSQDVLFDPGIDFAVLECARGGIIRSGLAFDSCDISIVTNISEDHLGLKDINTVEEMAAVKKTVPLTTKKDGYAILNADDELVYAMHKDLRCNIALFSLSEGNDRVRSHCKKGGMAAVVEEGHLIVYHGEWKIRIAPINDIPLSLNGRAECMIRNLLPAALAATILNFRVEDIRRAFNTFIPSPENTPGRMNIFRMNDFEIMVDYAHNVDGFMQLKKFMDRTSASSKLGIISVAGDRRDEDIIKIGGLSAEMFDEIIIRHDMDTRGRNNEEITALLIEGVKKSRPLKPVQVISSEMEAVQYAIKRAEKDAFIMVCSDKVDASIAFVANLVEENLNAHGAKAG